MCDTRSKFRRDSHQARHLLTGLIMTAACWCAHAQVSVVSVQPANNTQNVPVNSTLVFTFSAPIDPTTVSIVPANPLGFTGSISFSSNVTGTPQWSFNGDSTVLTITFGTDLPGGATITWTINPSSNVSGLPVSTEAADVVPTTTGSFTTAAVSSCNPSIIPTGYGSIFLEKVVDYQQTSDATPAFSTSTPPFLLNVAVKSPDANAVTNVSFTHPVNVTTQLVSLANSYYFFETNSTQAGLDTTFPAGSYSFNIAMETPPNPSQLTMTMPAATSYPPIPQISGYAAAQTINPTNAYTLSFNGFTGAAGNDAIQLIIDDSQSHTNVITAPDPCAPWVLAPTATSFVIPASTLKIAKIYTCTLRYFRPFYYSTNSPANFFSLGALIRETTFTIATGSGSVTTSPAQISGLQFQSGFFAFTVGSLTTGKSYRVQYSTTLQPGSWNDLQTINLPSGTSAPVFDASSSQTAGQRFYRVISP